MSAIDIIGEYGAAMAAGDMAALGALFAPDAVWHQPGRNPLSGDHIGPDAIVAHLGRFMELSGGTFVLEPETVTEAGALVSMTVRFAAQREDRVDLAQRGVDVFRVSGDRIAEVWLISEDQDAEDRFWAHA